MEAHRISAAILAEYAGDHDLLAPMLAAFVASSTPNRCDVVFCAVPTADDMLARAARSAARRKRRRCHGIFLARNWQRQCADIIWVCLRMRRSICAGRDIFIHRRRGICLIAVYCHTSTAMWLGRRSGSGDQLGLQVNWAKLIA